MIPSKNMLLLMSIISLVFILICCLGSDAAKERYERQEAERQQEIEIKNRKIENLKAKNSVTLDWDTVEVYYTIDANRLIPFSAHFVGEALLIDLKQVNGIPFFQMKGSASSSDIFLRLKGDLRHSKLVHQILSVGDEEWLNVVFSVDSLEKIDFYLKSQIVDDESRVLVDSPDSFVLYGSLIDAEIAE